jgi:outer membrane protein assembly factor BamB
MHRSRGAITRSVIPMALGRQAWPLVMLWSLLAAACNATSDTAPGNTMNQVWHAPLGSSVSSSWAGVPALDGAKLFVEDANNVVALDAASGAKLWSTTVRVFPSPAAQQLVTAAGTVFVSEATFVTALDENTGAIRWQFTPDSGAAGVFPSVDDRAYYTGQRGIPVVYALDRSTGGLLWRVNLGPTWQFPGFVSAVLVSTDTVFAVAERWLAVNGFTRSVVVAALNRLDGSELWRFETSSQHDNAWGAKLIGDLIVINDIIAGGAFAVSRSAHSEVWRLRSPNQGAGATALPAVNGGTVYVGTGGGYVFALDELTGRVIWTHQTQTYVWGVTTCGTSVVSNTANLERYDPASGNMTGHFNATADGAFTSNIVSDGSRVFVTGQDGVRAVLC